MVVHYGVVQQNGVWTIIGKGLRFGSYGSRTGAESARGAWPRIPPVCRSISTSRTRPANFGRQRV